MISAELRYSIYEPFRFKTPKRKLAYGYEVTLLPDLVAAILRAKIKGLLTDKVHDHIVARAEVLLQGFARVGIIALVDEATGYQSSREVDALQQYLRRFLSDRRLPWDKMFLDDYYREMFRLWGWPYRKGPKGPRYAGVLTLQLVYVPLLRTRPEMIPMQGTKWMHLLVKAPKGMRSGTAQLVLTAQVYVDSLSSWIPFLLRPEARDQRLSVQLWQ